MSENNWAAGPSYESMLPNLPLESCQRQGGGSVHDINLGAIMKQAYTIVSSLFCLL